PAIAAMRELVAQEAIGTPLAARISHVAMLPEYLRTWRITDPSAGCGPLNDMGTHDFDVLRYVLGYEVVEATGMLAFQGFAGAGIEDQAMAALRFAGGAVASFHASYNLDFGVNGFDVHGSEGSLLGRGVLSAVGGGSIALRDGDGERPVEHDSTKI